MALSRSQSKICEVLLKAGLVDELQLRSATARMEQWGGFLLKVIADQGFAREEEMATALAQALKVPFQRLHGVAKDGPAQARLDAAFCEEKGVFPISLKDRVLTLAMVDPLDLDIIDDVQARVGVRVHPVLAMPTEVLASVARHYRGQALVDDFRRGAARPSTRMAEEHSFELDVSEPPPPGGEAGALPDLRLGRPASANTLLDELVGDEGGGGLSAEEAGRLQALELNQHKAGAILRALEALLQEKGYR